jgi:hypothetical protein
LSLGVTNCGTAVSGSCCDRGSCCGGSCVMLAK